MLLCDVCARKRKYMGTLYSNVKSALIIASRERRETGLNILFSSQGLARTQSPTTKNYAPELPTFGVIARVSPTEVQWKGLALRGPP